MIVRSVTASPVTLPLAKPRTLAACLRGNLRNVSARAESAVAQERTTRPIPIVLLTAEDAEARPTSPP